jgi:DNA repair exonuclease SbcCD ATPase subunit
VSENVESRFVPGPLDSPQACVKELSEVNTEVATIGQAWAANAGELKEKIMRRDRLHRAALLGITEKLTVAEKEATAFAAIEQREEGLLERIEELEGLVEQDKTLFKSLERRASNAQSILSALRAEVKMGDYVADQPQWSGSRG